MTIIKDAIDHLTAVEDLLIKLGPIEDACEKAAEELEATELALKETKKELADANSGLTKMHLKNLRDYEESIFDKSQQAKVLDAKIATAQTQLDTLSIEINSAATRHQQIEDSITSLRKLHFG